MNRSMDKVDGLILLLGAVCAIAAVGMVTDFWPVVYFAIPIVTVLLCVMGSMRRDLTWRPASVGAVAAFSAGLLALFVWGAVGMNSDQVIWGLQEGMAVFVYFIWPYTTVFSGLLYAYVFSESLRQEITTNL